MRERRSEWPSNLRVDYVQFQPTVQGVMRRGMHLTFGYHTLFPFSLFKAWDENETELTHKGVVQQKCCRAEMQLERKTTVWIESRIETSKQLVRWRGGAAWWI